MHRRQVYNRTSMKVDHRGRISIHFAAGSVAFAHVTTSLRRIPSTSDNCVKRELATTTYPGAQQLTQVNETLCPMEGATINSHNNSRDGDVHETEAWCGTPCVGVDDRATVRRYEPIARYAWTAKRLYSCRISRNRWQPICLRHQARFRSAQIAVSSRATAFAAGKSRLQAVNQLRKFFKNGNCGAPARKSIAVAPTGTTRHRATLSSYRLTVPVTRRRVITCPKRPFEGVFLY